MHIKENILQFKLSLPSNVTLIAVTKTHPPEVVLEAYNAGHKVFGENKVQEMLAKYEALPKDIQWHLIGHLQTNKVKYIAPFVELIHSVDSIKLLKEIDKQAAKNNRVINCLLQIYIAKEETKFGLSFEEAEALINSNEFKELKNIKVLGLMGMASNTEDLNIVRNEFKSLHTFYTSLSQLPASNFDLPTSNFQLSTLSMGMSSDYTSAIEEGSNMIRVGSIIFGHR